MDNLDLSNLSMLDLFSLEVEAQAEILNENLVALEKQLQHSSGTATSEALPLLEALMRASHSIKGAARIVQIEPAVKMAHVMEDCFVAAMDRTITLQSEQIDCLLKGVDFLLDISRVEEATFNEWLCRHQQAAETAVNAIAAILGRRKSDTKSVDTPVSPPEPASSKTPLEASDDSPSSRELSLDDVFPEFDEPEIVSGRLSNAPTVPDLTKSSQAPPLKGEDAMRDSQSRISASVGVPMTFSQASGFSLMPVADADGEPVDEVTAWVEATPDRAAPLPTSANVAHSGGSKERFVRVSTDCLSRLMGLAGESLVEATSLTPLTESLLSLKKSQLELSKLLEKLQISLAKNAITQESELYLTELLQKERECRTILGDRLNALEQFAYRSYNLSDRLYREVIAVHMRPFEEGVQSFPRLVRDLARKLNKQVKLEINGKTTLVDRDILRKLEVPLTHILQNAIDHGIESSEERIKQGKPSEGTIRLEASHRFGMLLIIIADDGKGIELDQLRESIVKKRLVTPEMAKQLSEAELMEFIFLPSFSTTDQVTEISGRGVGLNIAKTMVQEVGGNLQATSKPGKGISFHFQLPLTLSVIRTLIVEIAGEPYAFPLSRIDQIVLLDPQDISYVESRQYFTLNDKHIGLIKAEQVLELTPVHLSIDKLSIVVISDAMNRYGLVVDRLLGEKNLVVRPLDSRLGKVQDISSAALLEDGTPILILDVLDLVRSIDKLLSNSLLSQIKIHDEITWTQTQKRILVVDDSITVREMERKLLQNHGYQVDIAVDGMEGWNAVRVGNYDLIISDIDMPRMNGIKLVGQIKKHPQLKAIPVIVVSYKDREEDRLQGLEAGADYYLTKSSFHDDTFIKAVVDLIGQ